MEALQDLLKGQQYKKVKFKITKTNHLLIKAKINDVLGSFILDTGASNTCIGFESVNFFELTTSDSENKAAGAGALNMETLVSRDNVMQIGNWKKPDFALIVFDMSHVNEALISHKAKPVQGIIGADVLISGQAIIDYYNLYLYLKM